MQRILFSIVVLLMALPHTAFAETIISTGIINIHRADSLWTHGPARISTIDAAPGSEDLLIPLVSIEARFGNRDQDPLGSGFAGESPKSTYREIYIGAPQSEWGKIGVGLRDYRPGRGTLNGFIHITPYKEVWENPYLTGTERAATGSVNYGARLEWEATSYNDFSLVFTYDAVDVDNDLIGRIEPALKRSGSTYGSEVSFMLSAGRGFSFEFGGKYSTGHLDGRANSFRYTRSFFSFKRFTEKYIANIRLFTINRDYKEAHPLFGTTRQEDGRGAFAMLLLPGAFGNPDTSFSAGAIYGETDSNINFFDTHQAMAFASVGFRI